MGHEVVCAWVDLRGRDGLYGCYELAVPPWAQEPMRHADVDLDKARYLYGRLVVAWAGLVAEEEFCDRNGLDVTQDTDSDQDHFVSLLTLLVGNDDETARLVLSAATACAEEILGSNWAVVESVAEALARWGDPAGQRICEVVSGAGGVRMEPAPLPAPLAALTTTVSDNVLRAH